MKCKILRTYKRGDSFCCVLLLIAIGNAFAYSQRTDTAGEVIASTLVSEPGPTFRVPDDQISSKWTIIAYGDMRFTDPSNHEVTNPEARRALVSKIASEYPDAVLLSGDIPYNGANANDYAVYRSETTVWRDEKLRIYPALGNHELQGREVKQPNNWWNTFPVLKGRRWYSVEIGNAYLICVDSDLPLTAGSRQQKWLADQLENLPKKSEFVFLALHHPPVADSILNNPSHDVRPNEKALAVFLKEEAPKLHARMIIIAGHIHNYERFYRDGVVYLVSGGGGAKPYRIARTSADLYQDPSFPNYHYIRFSYDGIRLNVTMLRFTHSATANPIWESKDEFTVEGSNRR